MTLDTSEWRFTLLLETGDQILMEDSNGVLVLEIPANRLNNYMAVRAGDGISVGERIR